MLDRIEMQDVRKLLPSGTVLWRPVDHLGLMPVHFTAGKKQDAICRILPAGFKQEIAEPVINPYTGGNPQYGVVAIVPYEVTSNWCYMIVTGHDRAGRSVFAKPYEYDVQSYITFRDEAATISIDNITGVTIAEHLKRYAALKFCVPYGARRQLYFDRVERVFYGLGISKPAFADQHVPG